ncbi:PAS domain S-box protein [bacterium]|nr:PAS domain S-box protein [bacterium]
MNLLRKYFLLGAIPALIAVGLATILESQITQKLLGELIDQSVNSKLDSASIEVRCFLDQNLSILEAISVSPDVAEGSLPEIVAYLKAEETVLHPRVEGLYYCELNGTVHGSDGKVFDVSDRGYMQDVREGKTVITRVLTSRATGNDILLLMVPSHAYDGTLKGAVSLTIPESQVESFVRTLRVDNGGFFALLDHEKRMIVATPKADFLRDRSLKTGTELVADEQGLDYMISVGTVPGTQWQVVAAVPEAELKAIYHRMGWSKVTAVASGITVAVILALFFSERAMQPVRTVTQTIRRYARGDRSARFPEPAKGEFAILAESFNNMADEIDAARTKQEEQLQKLELSEDRFRRLFDGAADAIFLRDLDGNIIDANQEACRSLGYQRHELIRMTVADIDMKWTKQDAQGLWNRLAREGGRYHPLVERVHRRKDGSSFPVEIRLTLIERDGEALVMSAARDATMRKAAEKQLHEAKDFAEKVINASPGIIYIFDLIAETVLFINDNFEKELGYTRDYVENLGARFYVEIVHPEDIPRLQVAQKDWKAGDKPIVRRDNFRIRHANGEWLWMEFDRVVFQYDKEGNPTHILGVATNITDRVRAEQQLVWEKALLDQVMETSVAAIMVLDVEGKIQFMNTALEKMLRVGRKDVLGKGILSVKWDVYDMSGQPLPPEKRPFAIVKRTAMPIYDFCMQFQFGPESYAIVSNNGAPLFDEDQRFAGAVFALTDITERIESERIRDSLIRDLEATNSELKQFTYTVSHDLKSPLITIKGFLGILAEDIESQDRGAIAEDLNVIGSAADGMKQLLDDLLELSRIGRSGKVRTTISVDDVVREAITLLAGEIDSRRADVQFEGNGLQIYGDSTQIRQLMQNLIDNAIKHNHSDVPQVKIQVFRDQDDMVIDVSDNGPGIPQQYQERIFHLFDKLDPDSDGTGIGLAIVKRIVEFHGGSISLPSDMQQSGATFRIRLPAAAPDMPGRIGPPTRRESTSP